MQCWHVLFSGLLNMLFMVLFRLLACVNWPRTETMALTMQARSARHGRSLHFYDRLLQQTLLGLPDPHHQQQQVRASTIEHLKLCMLQATAPLHPMCTHFEPSFRYGIML